MVSLSHIARETSKKRRCRAKTAPQPGILQRTFKCLLDTAASVCAPLVASEAVHFSTFHPPFSPSSLPPSLHSFFFPFFHSCLYKLSAHLHWWSIMQQVTRFHFYLPFVFDNMFLPVCWLTNLIGQTQGVDARWVAHRCRPDRGLELVASLSGGLWEHDWRARPAASWWRDRRRPGNVAGAERHPVGVLALKSGLMRSYWQEKRLPPSIYL